jgi:hypothetical protein
MEVATPVIERTPLGTSSMYTPGKDKAAGMVRSSMRRALCAGMRQCGTPVQLASAGLGK